MLFTSGFSATKPCGVQSRVCFDHLRGFFAFDFAYTSSLFFKIATSSPRCLCAGVTNFIALWRCVLLYMSTKPGTHWLCRTSRGHFHTAIEAYNSYPTVSREADFVGDLVLYVSSASEEKPNDLATLKTTLISNKQRSKNK